MAASRRMMKQIRAKNRRKQLYDRNAEPSQNDEISMLLARIEEDPDLMSSVLDWVMSKRSSLKVIKLSAKVRSILNFVNGIVTSILSVIISFLTVVSKKSPTVEKVCSRLAVFKIASDLIVGGIESMLSTIKVKHVAISETRSKCQRFYEDWIAGDDHEDSSRVQLETHHINTCEFIDMNTFLINFMKVFEIKAVMSAFKSDEENDYSDFMVGISEGKLFGSYYILFKANVRGTMMPMAVSIEPMTDSATFYWKDSDSYSAGSDVLCMSYDDVREFVFRPILIEIMQSLKGKYLRIKGSQWSSNSYAIQMTPIDVPKYYDEEVVTDTINTIAQAVARKSKLSMLFYGHPGVGKTCALNRIISSLDAVVVNVGYSPEDRIVSLLNGITGATKVLVIEEVDANGSNSRHKDEHVRNILTLLDSDCYDIVIMTANSTSLYAALIRSGRCDIKLKFDIPNPVKRASIVANVAKDYGMALKDEEISYMVSESEGMSHADLVSMIKLSALKGIWPTEYLAKFRQDIEDMKAFEEAE